jgi:hypothetical protein
MTKSIDCIECGAFVPYGRLSCPTCGALLASVGGRPSVAAASIDVPGVIPEPYLVPDDDEAGTTSIWPSLSDATETRPHDERPSAVLTGRPYRLATTGESAAPAASAAAGIPGAYRLSALTFASATAETAPPGHATATADRSPAHAIDPARLADIAGWFVIVGSAMAVLGFLLPWSTVVIGARSAGSYFDSWGLASPTHVIVLGSTLVVLALAIVRTSVPLWLRSGVMPLALGSLLIGLVWPYEVGSLGADVGIVVVGLGGLAMVIGGVVTIVATRHVGAEPLV